MRYQLKFLQRAGLVPSLLIVGVLGGLMAPFPSEAAPPTTAPTVSVQMDTGTPIVITTVPLTCLAADTSAGYNYCYSVTTGGTVGTVPKQFQVQANGTPRVRVADKNGVDKISLTGVKFVPVTVPVTSWPIDDSHSLTITVTGRLDATTDPTGTDPSAIINATNAGPYQYALRSAGEFNANNATGVTSNNAVNNSITLTGTGTFSTANTNVNILSTSNPAGKTGTKNLTPLNFTIKGPAATADINWAGLSNTDMGQVDPYYPEFNCSSASNTAACRPTVTQTLVATIYGQDTLKVLSGPLDFFAVLCTETFSTVSPKQKNLYTAVVKFLKWIEPYIQKPAKKAKIQQLIIQLEATLVAANAPPVDLNCPGSQVLTYNVALEAGIDGTIIAQDTSSVGIPADPHEYVVISSPGITWLGARNEAAGLGAGWHLATITSAAEQAIINGLLPDPTSFPAGPAQQYWIGGEQSGESFYEPGGNWQWINSEGTFWNSSHPDGQNGAIPGMYANWGNNTNGPGVGLQPDDAGGLHQQNHLSLDHRYKWAWDDNDQHLGGYILGYVAERDPPPPPCVNC